MKKDHHPSVDAWELRHQAKQRFKEKCSRQSSANQGPWMVPETERLVQELQIHQIELEIQNEELKASREKVETLLDQYTDLYDFAPVAYLTLDRDGTILQINLTGALLLGAERARLVNGRFAFFVSADDRLAFNDFLQRVFTSQTNSAAHKATCEVMLCKEQDRPLESAPAGNRTLARENQRRVRIEGTVTADGKECRVVVSDMTEHNQKMDGVRDFLAKYSGPVQDEGFFKLLARYLAENLGMDFVCIDRLEGDGLTARTMAVWCEGTFQDNASYALKDTPCGEVVGKAVCCFPASVCQFFPHDQVLQDLRAESYVGVTLWGHRGQPIGLIAVIGRRPLANRRLAEVMLQLVAVRAAGEMERLDAEDVLRVSEERFRVIFERSTIGKSLTASDGKLLQINKAFADMLGYAIEEIQQLSFPQITHLDDVAESRKCIRILLANEQTRYRMEKRYIHKDGHIVWADVSTTLLRDEQGTPLYLITSIVDITDRKRAEKQLQDTLESLRRAISTTIQVMVSAVETRDPYTSGHQIRSADLARAIVLEMGLPQDNIDAIRMAGSIHDIGKLSIPAEILSKPTKLTNIEFALIKEHSRKGFEMLKDVESPWPLAEIVYQHHERMDGSGYPRNLKGEEICLEARILTVADVVEAMASHRPYRAGLGIEAALREIEKNSGIYYDAAVAGACLKLFREKGFKLEGACS